MNGWGEPLKKIPLLKTDNIIDEKPVYKYLGIFISPESKVIKRAGSVAVVRIPLLNCEAAVKNFN